MCHVDYEKKEKRNNYRNRAVKSGKHYNTWRTGKLRVSGKIGSRPHQTNRNEIKR